MASGSERPFAHLWQVVESPHRDDLLGNLQGGVLLPPPHKVLRHGLEDGLGAAPRLQAVLHDCADELWIALLQPP